MAVVDEQGAVGVPEVRDRLREAVLKGRLRESSLHSQDAVMELLGVRRTPFREAVRMVQAEGLLEVLPNGRLKVPELSLSAFGEIQIARIALESAAVRLAVPRLDMDDLARLEGLMAEMSHYLGSADFERLERPHVAFHLGLVAPAGPVFLGAIADLIDRVRRYRWAFATGLPRFWEERFTEHRAILDAAKAGDGEAVARELARHHIEAGMRLARMMGAIGGATEREKFARDLRESLPPEEKPLVRMSA